MNFLEVAVAAAREAGKKLMNSFGKLRESQIENKQLYDYVTQVDKESEQVIIKIIKEAFPEHRIFSEETGKLESRSDYCWVIDPLDGTTNYIHSFPFCSVSIALMKGDEIILGVVFDPFRNELFHAIKDEGAFLNNQKIEVSKEKDLSRCLLGTGFPFKNKDLVDLYLQSFSTIFKQVSGLRRAGSAALDLSYVACGRLEGFREIKLSAWDIAAGIILVREAGGRLSDMDGSDNYMKSGNIVVSNGFIHDEILAVTEKVFKVLC